MKLEVRCCCQPQKLLGWLEVPEPNAARVVFALSAGRAQPSDELETMRLEIAKLRGPHSDYRALKAEGASFELLRRIPGFVEAEPPA